MIDSSVKYFEDLNVGFTCPHDDSFVPDGEKIYYRLLKINPICSECFLPTPISIDRPLPDGFDNCIEKSVSLYDDLEGMINGIFRMPSGKQKKKQISIGLLKLKSKDGLLKQTFGKNHHSWWRSDTFDVSTVIIKEMEI